MNSIARPSAVAASDSILSVNGLSMRFGGLTAIRDLSFAARRLQITSLIGPNGAGKTTLFNCITGFYRPSSGSIMLHRPDGIRQELSRLSRHAIAAKTGVARTFQNIRLFPGMTVMENLLVAQHNTLMRASCFSIAGILGSRRFRLAEKQAVEKAAAWLGEVHLLENANDLAGNLPYGGQRRLEIARAMCTGPVLLCLDEPAAGLNPRETYELGLLVDEIRSRHSVSVLLIEHDMSMVMEISDHIVVLDHGQKIADGTPDLIRNNEAVIAAYLGVEETVREAGTGDCKPGAVV